MTRRLGLFAAVLFLIAMPALARRRAITPGAPTHCANATLVSARYAQVFAMDDQFVYFVDEMDALARVPRLGGEVQELTDPLDDWLPLSIVVDATHVYIGALPIEALFLPGPGVLLTVPKSGGVPSVLLSDVITPLELAIDDTHIYWASTGTFNFMNGGIASDGKIERVTKNGATRNTFATDLSGALGIAIDANDIYFGEAGIADDDDSVGLYRVAKSGGDVATLSDEVAVGPIRVDGNTLVFFGTTETASGVLAMEKDGASPLRTLYSSDRVETGLRVADRRAYFLQESDGPGSELAWVSIDAPAGAVRARGEIDGEDFLLDGCAAIVNTIDGEVVRTVR